MDLNKKWIWLSSEKYPDRQKTRYNAFMSTAGFNYTVAEFKRSYQFDKKIKSMRITFSADTAVQLFCNGNIVATGPATVEGDFLGNDKPRANHYAMTAEISSDTDKIELFARVKLMPTVICEFSQGQGGFVLVAELEFCDGSRTSISTDESWQARCNYSYVAPYAFDGTHSPDEYSSAAFVDDVWNLSVVPIKVRCEEEIFPESQAKIDIDGLEEFERVLNFDMIHAGFIHLNVEAKRRIELEIICRETENDIRASRESFVFDSNTDYRGLELHSVGQYVIKVKNCSDEKASITASLIATYYPVSIRAKTITSDGELNDVLDICAHTLKYCRQLHHLDSPRHCEPLACTGDYYIESLMTSMSFGDMSLAELDVVRTAHLLRGNDGRMFHTTYSLIWAKMLLDVYMITGNIKLLQSCRDALDMLLARFERYIGENGLIETPPDYMFIDWIYIDGLSMHHPPKALGQTALNIFYFGALDAAEKIYKYIGRNNESKKCRESREKIREAINTILFDKEREVYFEGLNTETPEDMIYTYLPRNVDKRYYLKHSNILAACFGVCERDVAVSLIDKVMSDEIEGDYQPYFAHYLLEAIFNLGLCDKYTLKVVDKWKAPVRECPKGLVEGFVAPEPGYIFDHSHAWGGTPLYSLPKALVGLKIIEPGMTHIELSPSLLGLKEAKVEIPTPYGMVVCNMKEGDDTEIFAPEEIKVDIRA